MRPTRLLCTRLEDRSTPAIDLTLSGATVAEFRTPGTEVGALAATEPGTGHAFSYALVAGDGADDNADFSVTGNNLFTESAFNAAAKNSYTVRVRATDENGQTAEMPFTVSVADDPNVALVGKTLYVAGTTGHDSFTYADLDFVEDGSSEDGPTPVATFTGDFSALLKAHLFDLNGVALGVESADVDAVVFNGMGGDDGAYLEASRSTTTGVVVAPDASNGTPGYGMLAGGGFAVYVDAPWVTITGRIGNTTAYLAGTSGDDALTAGGNYATLTGAGYFSGAVGFTKTAVYGNGGNDSADMGGNLLPATLNGGPTATTMAFAVFSYTAVGFAQVNAYAGTPGGVADLDPGTGNGVIAYADGTNGLGVTLTGTNYRVRATGFDLTPAAKAHVHGGLVAAPGTVGGLDPSFGTGGRTAYDLDPGGRGYFTSVAVQTDGKIVAAGTDYRDVIVVRFLPNGAVDTTFGTGGKRVIDFGGEADEAHAVEIDATGRIVVVGGKAEPLTDFVGDGPPPPAPTDRFEIAVARLNSDGDFDSTFGAGGITTVDTGYGEGDDVAIDSAGRLVVVGNTGSDMSVVRFDADGKLDATFGTNGVKQIPLDGSHGRAVFVDGDGKIVVAGSEYGSASGLDDDFVAVRLDADGHAIDPTFGDTSLTIQGTTFNAAVIDFGGGDTLQGATRDASGRYLLVGTTTTSLSTTPYRSSDFAVARLTPAGARDQSFGSGGEQTFDAGGYDDEGESVYVQPDGRIVVAGTSYSTTRPYAFAAARLTAAGAFDATFGVGGGVLVPSTGDDEAFGAAEGDDGGVVLAGAFGSKDGTVGGMVRLVGSDGVFVG